MALTNGQKTLVSMLNQMSQSLTTDASQSLQGIDLGRIIGKPTPPSPTPPSSPTTIREVLLSLVNEQVQITTPFGAVTGTLLLVKNDYIVVIEATGDQALVRIDKIELVSEL